MADSENIASFMARKDYAKALPLLRVESEKYPSNVRIRLQLADALAGAGLHDEALLQYEQTAKYYDENGLIVQAIAVRKKSEKLRERVAPPPPEPAPAAIPARPPVPESPLFEDLAGEEREALVNEMELVEREEGDIIITEGEQGGSLYVVVSGEVKVFTRGPRGENVLLATLGEGEFFGEISVLTGKPRTATITAARRTELLCLEKDKLDNAIEKHPRIRQILDGFYRRRADRTVEAMIENLKQKGAGS